MASALFDFLIELVILAGVGGLFFAVIDRIAPDASFAKIARIAVGVTILVIVLLGIKAVLFGGAGMAVPSVAALINFAIGAIVVLLILFLVNLALDYFGAMAGLAPFTTAIKYVIASLALIALLYLMAGALLGSAYPSVFPHQMQLR